MENDLTSEQTLKSLFFQNETKFFGVKTKKQDFHIKATSQVLKNITSQKEFHKIRDTYKLKKYISKILLKSHLEWITFVYYKDEKLILGAKNHIGQSELNMQKHILIENFKKIEAYKNISSVNIIRDEKFTSQEKTTNIPKNGTQTVEKSYGIFENNITDTAQFQIVERIKKSIRNFNS
jgi:hypothetical protein